MSCGPWRGALRLSPPASPSPALISLSLPRQHPHSGLTRSLPPKSPLPLVLKCGWMATPLPSPRAATLTFPIKNPGARKGERGPFRCSRPREAFGVTSWERLALTLLAWGTACSPSSSPSSVPHVSAWPPLGHEALSAGLAGQSGRPVPAEPGTVVGIGRPNSSRKLVSAR